MASTAHAEDWLAGDYEVVIPGKSGPARFALVITKDADGRYHDEVFSESIDAASGRLVRRPVPQAAGVDTGVRVLAAAEMTTAGGLDLAAANVRCASVDGMVLCQVPEGASVRFGDQTVSAGYFGGAMHVGLIEVRKRAAAMDPQASAAGQAASR